MPEFHLDTSGKAYKSVSPTTMEAVRWADLDSFTQGYVEAMFFTENAPGVNTEEWQATDDHDEGTIPDDVAFADLAPEALAKILADCAAFQANTLDVVAASFAREQEKLGEDEQADDLPSDDYAGHDFWLTRNGHGVGFWDGGWPEPYATHLTDAAKAFGEVNVYLGDDGKVYVS